MTDDNAIIRFIEMSPFGKARPRVTRNGTFMPRDYEAKRHELRLLFGSFDPPPLVNLSIIATRAMPQSWSKARRAEMAGKPCKPKPDVDNIAGAVMDALFTEDDIVVSVCCRKIWGQHNGLAIKIEEAQ